MNDLKGLETVFLCMRRNMREGACCSWQQPLLSCIRKDFIYVGSENHILAADLVSTAII